MLQLVNFPLAATNDQQHSIVAAAQSAMALLPNNDLHAQNGPIATSEQAVSPFEAVFQPAVEERNIASCHEIALRLGTANKRFYHNCDSGLM